MEQNKFNAILIFLVPNLIKIISEQTNLSELDATKSLYESELYSALEREETKLWHLSPQALYSLYSQEKSTGKIIYPEEA